MLNSSPFLLSVISTNYIQLHSPATNIFISVVKKNKLFRLINGLTTKLRTNVEYIFNKILQKKTKIHIFFQIKDEFKIYKITVEVKFD